jgi:hypothetical protein
VDEHKETGDNSEADRLGNPILRKRIGLPFFVVLGQLSKK